MIGAVLGGALERAVGVAGVSRKAGAAVLTDVEAGRAGLAVVALPAVRADALAPGRGAVAARVGDGTAVAVLVVVAADRARGVVAAASGASGAVLGHVVDRVAVRALIVVGRRAPLAAAETVADFGAVGEGFGGDGRSVTSTIRCQIASECRN